MIPQTSDLAAVVERLERLERAVRREKRRSRWLLVAVGLGGAGLVLAWTLANTTATAQAQGANTGSKVIRARQVFLEDEKGTARVGLGVDRYGPALVLVDEKGTSRVALTLSKNEPKLVLTDEKGKSRLTLTMSKEGPKLVLTDEKGTSRVGLGVHRYNGAALLLADETGKVFWSQP